MKLNKKMNLSNFDYISYNRCTFCDSVDVTKIITIHQHPEVNYFFCNTCKVSYTDKQLSEASTKDIYANYFDDHQLKTGIEPKILGNHLFHFFSSKKTDFKNIKILDFGGGDGSISKYLGDKLKEHRCCENYTVDVFDLYECEQKIAGVNYLRSEAEIQNNTYDIVIASAVLEHLNSPMKKMHFLFNAMKSGGYFYARTPFRLPMILMFVKLKIKKMGMQFPWHLFDMGRVFWENIPHLFSAKHQIDLKIIASRPSVVQTPFKENGKKYLLSKIFKAPAYLFKKWNLVGGWEVFIQKI